MSMVFMILLQIICCVLTSIVLFMISEYIDKMKSPTTIREKSTENLDKFFDSYLVEDRKILVKKINETHSMYDVTKNYQKENENNIKDLIETFRNGVSVDDSDSISDRYTVALNLRKFYINETTRLKYELKHLYHILSVIDTRVSKE